VSGVSPDQAFLGTKNIACSPNFCAANRNMHAVYRPGSQSGTLHAVRCRRSTLLPQLLCRKSKHACSLSSWKPTRNAPCCSMPKIYLGRKVIFFWDGEKRELPLGLQPAKGALPVPDRVRGPGKPLQAVGWYRGARRPGQSTTLRRSDRHLDRPRPQRRARSSGACDREIERDLTAGRDRPRSLFGHDRRYVAVHLADRIVEVPAEVILARRKRTHVH
jgi:hypothetical protein